MINDFKRQCNEMNINTPAELMKALNRKGYGTSYYTLNKLWKGRGQYMFLAEVCSVIGIKSLDINY